MSGKREQLASALDRLGALDVIMRVRAQLRVPILSVLTYHHIDDPGDDYLFDGEVADATPAQFDQQLAVIARHCNTISIAQLLDAHAGREPLPANPVLITFDDGYRSCLETALPLLQRHGLLATFFIATEYVSKRKLYWWDRVNYLIKHCTAERISLEVPRPMELDATDRERTIGTLLDIIKNTPGLDIDAFLDELGRATGALWNAGIERKLADQLIMSWDDVRALRAAGMDVQSHTRRHRVLQTLDSAALADELAGSRAELERELGEPVRTIAYPVGRTVAREPEIRDAVTEAGYAVGFTNASGANYLWRRLDPLDVRRIAMGRDCSPSMFLGQLAIPPLAHVSPNHDR